MQEAPMVRSVISLDQSQNNASCGEIVVVVYDMSGSSFLRVQIGSNAQVLDLKARICEANQIPPLFQMLMSRRLMHDDDQIGCFLEQDDQDELAVELVTSVQQANQCLEDGTSEKQIDTLRLFHLLGSDPEKAGVVSVAISDFMLTKRRAAVCKWEAWRILDDLAVKGNQLAVDAVAALLDHKDKRIKLNAAMKLRSITADQRTIHAINHFLEHGDDCILVLLRLEQDTSGVADAKKEVALRALAAFDGNQIAVDLVIALLGRLNQDEREEASGTKIAALDALARISIKGNQQAIEVVRSCLWDHRDIVKQAASRALGFIASNSQRYKIFMDMNTRSSA